MAEEPTGFFGRWSRRKTEALQDGPLQEPLPLAPSAAPVVVPAPASDRAVAALEKAGSLPPGTQESDQALSLDDAQRLTPESDFTPFVARGVAPEVRNAAMKQLFSDPHFNMMDGLDIYIDDYTQPDPLPLTMLRQMASAKFLGMVEEDPEAPQDAAAKDPALACAAQEGGTQTHAYVAQSAPSPTTFSAPVPGDPMTDGDQPAPASQNDHAHADLRLQPDHAPPDPGAGTGTP